MTMTMTALEAFQASATAEVYLNINGERWMIQTGMRHSVGVAMVLRGPDGAEGRVDCPAGLEIEVEVFE